MSTIRLGFPYDRLTTEGHVYTKEALLNAFKDYNPSIDESLRLVYADIPFEMIRKVEE